eukprot:GGOE01003288.1.p1 GENE.GGOE01003288.1~~GGOE01003288.1.p1  ORF type:complete len:264 (+),score=39.61 GGOE01003288.1:22-792(+)
MSSFWDDFATLVVDNETNEEAPISSPPPRSKKRDSMENKDSFVPIHLKPLWFMMDNVEHQAERLKHRCDFHFYSGHYGKAYDEAMALLPNISPMSIMWKDVIELATLALLHGGRLEEAHLFVEKASALPAQAAMWQLQIQVQMKDYMTAIHTAQEALQLGQAGPVVWKCVAECFGALGWTHAARMVNHFIALRYDGKPRLPHLTSVPSPLDSDFPRVASLADLCRALRPHTGPLWSFEVEDGTDGDPDEDLPDANF